MTTKVMVANSHWRIRHRAPTTNQPMREKRQKIRNAQIFISVCLLFYFNVILKGILSVQFRLFFATFVRTTNQTLQQHHHNTKEEVNT